jgi:hypothetical protein
MKAAASTDFRQELLASPYDTRMPVALQQVFGITNSVNVESYIDRGGLDNRLAYGLATTRHVAIHGDSKQGKSWLREQAIPAGSSIIVQCLVDTTPESILTSALGQLGVHATIKRTKGNELEGTLDLTGAGKLGWEWLAKLQTEGHIGGRATRVGGEEVEPIGQTPGDLSWVSNILRVSGRWLIVEDFHYLSEANQRAFAFMLKALGEYGVAILIVGIWPQDHLLTYYNGDLQGRLEDIPLQWSDGELLAVLEKGGKALNVRFNDLLSRQMVADAYGNVGLLQQLAEQLCIAHGVFGAQALEVELTLDGRLDTARSIVANSMRGRFKAFADNFVRGMRRMPQGLEVYRHILETASAVSDEALLEGIDSAELLGQIEQHDEAAIRASDLTQALDRIDRLQAKINVSPPVLTYNRDSRKLFLGDRSFLFFRQYGSPKWPWTEGSQIINDLAAQEPLALDFP